MRAPDVSLDALATVVADAADRAMPYWRRAGYGLRHWDKSPGQPVSDADLLLDGLLKERLANLAPDAGWLSEESRDSPGRVDAERVWIVDPIDGTRDFVAGRTGWAVSVALAERGRVVLAVLAAPARGELWRAAEGLGGTLNGRRLRASGRTDLPGARVSSDGLPVVDRDLVMVEKPNSIALRMAMVADDRADLVATVRWAAEWDIAAASLIVAEAGGAVTDALGRPLACNRPRPVMPGMLACARGIHAAAVERLATRVPDPG